MGTDVEGILMTRYFGEYLSGLSNLACRYTFIPYLPSARRK